MTIGTTPTLITIGCTGATTGALPITTLPSVAPPVPQTSGALILGSDGNAASITNTTSNAVDLTATGGAPNFIRLDTGNAGAPSSITGFTNGASFQTTGGADIEIGQHSIGGAGLNANVIGQNGRGIFASALLGGNISIMTAAGTTVTGTGAQAIDAQVQNGNATIIVNGTTSVLPLFANKYSVQALSTGTGNIVIGGSGNFSSGVAADASGTGSIAIGGSGSTNFDEQGVVSNGLIHAMISNPASLGSITINRTGAVNGGSGQNGIKASNLGGGSIAITGVGNVTAGAIAIEADAASGPITIAPAGSVIGSTGIAATGPGGILINTTGNVTGTSGFGIATIGNATINVGAASVISGSSGPLSLNGTSIVNNAGTLNFINGATSNTVWNTTTLNGLGGRLAIDVNAAGGTADRLTVTTLSGNTVIQAHNIGGGLISSPIPVLVATASSGATVTADNGPSLINYSVQQSGNTFSLTSSVNTSTASATPAGIDAILTSLNTGFFQNASAFIAEPPHPAPNQWNGGPWVRFSGGQNDVSATTSAQNPGGTAFAPSKVRTNFNGFQTGIDLGVANVENTGWNTHLGVTAGQVLLNTNDLLLGGVNSASQVPFIGIYGALTGHGFFADFQVREDFYDLKLTNPAANLSDENLNGKAFAANVSAGYRWELPQSWFIEPSGALLYSQLHTDTLTVKLDPSGDSTGSLNFTPFNSLLGRLGFRVGTTYVLDKFELALQPFGTASVWHEFEGDTHTNFVSGSTIVPLAVTRIGTFGQLGLGVSGQVLQTGFLGFVRGDWRFGENLSGYAVVGGLRYQF
ncbi:autotransporter domain-containing protein [Methylocapsa palsarum]|uniref:autotransporter domain-containing protein n=1 Tax=Methylocapsa palsarum TaxID=1612308 RepID=UPI00158732CE|nr:autotransporter domain-containing protein [Methylocapsa palsarum]